MAAKLFVGSLPYSTTDDDLAELFSGIGTVVSAKVIIDRDTGRSKGFGFVELSSDDEVKKAIDELNGKEIAGRTIVVNEARPQENRSGGGGFGGGNRGGGDRRDFNRDRRY
jgi:cold-inducible RNA-binding protein